MNTMQELIAIVNEYKGASVNVTEATTFDELGFDSLDKVELMMQLEEKLGITIDENVTATTLGELAAVIDSLKA